MRSRLKAITFLLVIGFSSLLLAAESVRIALATRLGKSDNIVQIRKAVSLDPANPELRFRLAAAETYSLESADPADGIRQLQRATELSPRETRYWRALAAACEFEGDKTCASHAISRSVALSPMAPLVHWEAANYYLWADDKAQAFGEFQRLLELNAGHAGQVFGICLGATGSPEFVYHNVLPPDASPKLKLDYVNYLANHNHEAFAFHVWNKVASSQSPFKFSLADPYLEHLIGSQRYQQATAVWADLERRGIIKRSAGRDPSNLVFNGGFEHTPLNAGFDWRYKQEPYVAIDFRARRHHQGNYSLRLDFTDVENHEDQPVYQFVPVAADQNYELTAYVRSANITSGSGPRLRVVDPWCPSCVSVSSSPVVGTMAWHKIVLEFQTSPKTSLVRVSVWRPRSLNYPTEILGTLWLDQVSLKADKPPADQVAQRKGV